MPVISCPIDGCPWKSDNLDGDFANILQEQLQMHDRVKHLSPLPTENVPAPSQHKLKLDPPEIGVGANPEEWSSFIRQWSMFKIGTSVPESKVATALFYCASKELRQDLMRDLRCDVAAMAEKDLLEAMRRLAVKEESSLVHRIKLSKMTQSPGMSVRTFLANLRGQAALCNFTAACREPQCTHTFDYSDEFIKDNLIRGLADPEILSDLLGDAKTDRTLEETVTFIAQKEQGKATRSAVGDNVAGAANKLQPDRKNPNSRPNTDQQSSVKCWACDGPIHGARNDRNARSQRCPAWQVTCSKCNIRGHYSKTCSKCSACDSWGHRNNRSRFCSKQEKQNANQTTDSNAFQTVDERSHSQLASVNTRHRENATHSWKRPMEHLVFEGNWIPKPSKPHPMVLAELEPLPGDHAELGYPVGNAGTLRQLKLPMIADSGCQSSIIPLTSALRMGYSRNDIMPVSLSMKGAIHEDLAVEGAIIVKVSVKDATENPKTSRQMIYVSSKMEKAFLCREAMEKLGILPQYFPEIRSSLTDTDQVFHAASNSEAEMKCNCPPRGKVPPQMPKALPPGMSATEQDLPKLKAWLLDYYASTTFNTCEHQTLPMMSGEPLKLYVNPDAKPVAVHRPASVPIHWQEKVYHDLERDVKLGVLEKVPPNTPVTWCSRMVVTSKSDGSPRRTVDLQPQNKHAVRQTHHVPTPFHLADRVPQNTKKTVTDAWNGYHSIPIAEEDRHITTFITPWGRYRYKVAPQGFISSGDGYNQRFDAIISDFPNKVKCVDDTCMWSNSIEEAFFQACKWFDLCARNGITLNPTKFQFAEDSVDFAGTTITPTSVKPNQKFLDSIIKFPTPKDITGARAWFGLVNQGAYAFSVAREMKPFRHLLKPSTKFVWTEELQRAFEESKNVMLTAMKDGVRLFDPTRPTNLATDWSIDGIGFILRQKHCSCTAVSPICCDDGWKLCLVGSRFTTDTESRYSPIEGEALAIAWALNQTKYYVLGCPILTVTTDHKPLIQILNDRSLTDIPNRRLLNLKEKTLEYQFTILHTTGVKNKGADAASRYPAETSQELTRESHDMADEISIEAEASVTLYATSNLISWDMVKEETKNDENLCALMSLIREGIASIQEMPKNLRQFHQYTDQLYIIDGVIMLGKRIVIPNSLQPEVLTSLHAAHQGVNAMCQRASDCVFWPGITTDITRTRNECIECHRIAKSNAMEPPVDISQPEYPFQLLCCDYMHFNNRDYLVIVDRYSNWPIVFEQSGKAETLVKKLREVFTTFGVPEELSSDGGPQFTAGVTQEFLKSWGVHHRLSSVANPHSNNRAEVAVKTVKRMLMANTSPSGSLNIDAFQRAMLIYRNNPDPETKTSPSIIIFGHPTRDPIPTALGHYCPHPTWQETMVNREKALAKRHSREKEKWSEHTKDLKPLGIADHVYVQNLVGNHPLRWERTGVVVEIKPFNQYAIRLDGSGRVTLRNRKHLRKFTPFTAPRDAILRNSIQPPINAAKSGNPTIAPPKTPVPDAPQRVAATPRPPQQPINHDETQTQTAPVQGSIGEPLVHNEPGPMRSPPGSPPTPHTQSSGGQPPDPQPPQKKPPLALRRLLPHNKAGEKE